MEYLHFPLHISLPLFKLSVSHQGIRVELYVPVRNIPAMQLFFDKEASEN
jgi:hypothetical protein